MRKSDHSTGIGLILGTICIVASIMIAGNIWGFWDLASVFITIFGSFFALMINFPIDAIKNLPRAVKNAFYVKQVSVEKIVLKFMELSKKARREGLLSLEDELSQIGDEFFRNGMQMVVDGIEPETIREILDLEIGEMERRHQSAIAILKAWASFAPAFGMIGTLIGLIVMLANLSDTSSLGPAMSVALITSFYGAVMANFVFTPLAGKLEFRSEEEANRREMIIEGILSIQSGVNPRIVLDKLKTYLSPSERLKLVKLGQEGGNE